MTFIEAKLAADALDAKVAECSAALQEYPRGALGLVSDEVKATPEYIAAKRAYDTAFKNLRAYNAVYTRIFAKEIRQDRAARRISK